MLSTSIFSANGSIYHQSAVFDRQFQLNKTALQEVGLPALTGSNAWKSLSSNLAVCFWAFVITGLSPTSGISPDRRCFRSFHPVLGPVCSWVVQTCIQWEAVRPAFPSECSHYNSEAWMRLIFPIKAMKKYKEAPWWWYILLLVLSFIAGLYVFQRFLYLSDPNLILRRFNCRIQRRDYASLVVVYHRFDPRHFRYGKIFIRRLYQFRSEALLYAAFLHRPSRPRGQWNFDYSIDEDGRRCD